MEEEEAGRGTCERKRQEEERVERGKDKKRNGREEERVRRGKVIKRKRREEER